MREIDISPYKVYVDGILQDYNTKESLVNILFIRGQGISARETILRNKLAITIENCKRPTVLIEEADWSKMVSAIDHLKDISRNDIEIVRRVLEAREVAVEKTN